jgi:hypothetical protein
LYLVLLVFVVAEVFGVDLGGFEMVVRFVVLFVVVFPVLKFLRN